MSPTRMSRVESALRLALAFHQARNRQDLAAMLAQLGNDCRFESFQPAPDGQVLTAKEAIAQFWMNFFQAWPQAQFESEDAFGLGEYAILRWRLHYGQAEAALRGIEIFRVRAGLICEQRAYVKGSLELEQ